MERLLAIYKQRLLGVRVQNARDLKGLMERDIKLFYFYLMYCYLSNKDLSGIVDCADTTLQMGISLFCQSDNGRVSEDVRKYFRRFMDIEELTQQISKIHNEVDIMKAKSKYAGVGTCC